MFPEGNACARVMMRVCRVDPWECYQHTWQTTCSVLEHHRDLMKVRHHANGGSLDANNMLIRLGYNNIKLGLKWVQCPYSTGPTGSRVQYWSHRVSGTVPVPVLYLLDRQWPILGSAMRRGGDRFQRQNSNLQWFPWKLCLSCRLQAPVILRNVSLPK